MFQTIATTAILLSHLAITGGILWYFLDKQSAQKHLELIKPHTLKLAILIGIGGTLGSLFFSYGIGFAACILCLIQRFILIGATIFLGTALTTKYKSLSIKSALTLLIAGIIISIYHSALQYFPALSSLSLCHAIGGVSCTMRHIFAYNYITIPVMSLTTFAIMLGLVLISQKKST